MSGVVTEVRGDTGTKLHARERNSSSSGTAPFIPTWVS